MIPAHSPYDDSTPHHGGAELGRWYGSIAILVCYDAAKKPTSSESARGLGV